MLKITVATKTESNVTITANSVVEYDPYFITDRVVDGAGFKEEHSIIYTNKVWWKDVDYQDGVTPEIGGNFKEYGRKYKYTLTAQEFADLKAQTGQFTNVFNGVENIIIKAIEDGWKNFTGVGTGNVVHYDAIMI